jgi:hypothetical protein
VSYQKSSKPLIFSAGIAVALGAVYRAELREEYTMVQGQRLVLFLLILVVSPSGFAADSSTVLTVTTLNARLYPHQDNESKFIATLENGEKLQPLAQGVGYQAWYMVKSSKGLIGWVQATDVSSGDRVAEAFRDTEKVKAPQQPTGFLSECLERADEVHKKAWNKNCEINELGTECDGRGLPNPIADSLMRDRRAARDECIKVHSIKSITGK